MFKNSMDKVMIISVELIKIASSLVLRPSPEERQVCRALLQLKNNK